MWFIAVEVEQETSAPRLQKNSWIRPCNANNTEKYNNISNFPPSQSIITLLNNKLVNSSSALTIIYGLFFVFVFCLFVSEKDFSLSLKVLNFIYFKR